MNNYTNVRLQPHNHTKTFNSIKHNLRVIQSLNQNLESQNNNYIMLDNQVIKLTNENKKEIYEQLSSAYQQERQEHNHIYKQLNKRNLRDCKSTWCEGVFTFSEQLKEDLKNKKYTLNDLMKVANDCLKEIASTYDTKINYMTLHLDETTPHFHFSISNHDEQGMSLFHSNKNKEFLSKLQDIGFKHFSKLGMERGISKEITGVNNKSIQKHWRDKNIQAKQLNNSLNKQNIELTNSISKKQIQINDLDIELNDLKLKKIDLDIDLENTKKLRLEVQNDTSKSVEEKKRNYEEITKQQKQIRALRQVYTKREQSIKDLKKEIMQDMREILENSKKFVGYDEQKLQQNIFNKLNKYSKTKLRIKELEENQKTFEKLKNDNIILLQQLTKKDKKIESLEDLNLDKTRVIAEYKQKEDKERSFTNSEVANVTAKFVNEVNALKQDKKQLENKVNDLESKNKYYENFIIDNNLQSDFNNSKNKNSYNRYR